MALRNALCVMLILCATIFGENRTLENNSNSEKRTTDTATCYATGDPHYHTFDGKRYDFMGLCEYVLSKDLDNSFKVLTKNELCNHRYSCVASVTVFVKGLKLSISRGGLFTVFGIPKTAPYINQGVLVKKSGNGIQINTDIGLAVVYDGVYNVFVTIPSRFRGKTAGLCGNYNGNINDEYMDVNLHLSDTIVDFADSWNVDRRCKSSGSNPRNPCLTASSIAQEAKKKCQLLKQQPFEKCHNSVNQDSGFIKDCEYDVCACNNHPSSCLCEEFAAYTTSCSLVGVSITWKNLPRFAECNAPCAAAPCRNGGTCSNHGDDYKCTCADGYTGKQCDTGIGDRIIARWKNNKYYAGKISFISRKNKSIGILFDDGDKITHPLADVSAVFANKEPVSIKYKDHVIAPWKGSYKQYIGFVIKVGKKGYFKVRFDDNDEALYKKDKLRILPEASSPHQVGARVFARWSNGLYYKGFVSESNQWTVSINYDDGDKITLPKCDCDKSAVILDKIPQDNLVKTGQNVIGYWPGRVRYYPGHISRSCNHGKKYFLKFNDGDERCQAIYELRTVP